MSNQSNPDITFYGKMLTFSRVKLNTDNFDIIKKQLETISPTKDSKIPIVIESSIDQDLEKLVDLFWSWGLQPIGVVTGLLDEQAKKLKIALFPADGKRIERITPTHKTIKTSVKDKQPNDAVITEPQQKIDNDNSSKDDNITNNSTDNSTDNSNVAINTEESTLNDTTKSENTATHEDTIIEESVDLLNSGNLKYNQYVDNITSLVYDKMLRSGQSINHVGGDLILTSTVNNGSEVITDNSLHIYGKGLGRLVAGATGDKDAHIFCQVFNPTLVSVAGTYCLRDNIPEEYIDKPVHISYKEGNGLVYRVMDN